MKKYRNDYRKKGNRYEYTGQWYRTRLSEQELKNTVLSSMILGILALGFYIGGMCLNNNGSRVAWVLLPFVFQLLPVAYVIAGSGALYLRIRQNGENTSALVEIPQAHKKDLSRADYEKQVKRPWRCSLGILILCVKHYKELSCTVHLVILFIRFPVTFSPVVFRGKQRHDQV